MQQLGDDAGSTGNVLKAPSHGNKCVSKEF